ncbi:MAG: branched-chain amino acid ABC transporter permease [Betaproteobacteria bacterium]|nr:branched-chain amino acid ABC transporter permease [Betaproteobacteria bacterium]NBQ78471.1 branched-chain amino acid ABC transporter permease [Betaproteobacteria bacterium]NBT71696.1 branched-chain amino acid ABC transporter permease [Betaproteobacteria bacterium]NBY54057.1 branched-chain amino acid ABC transporter permease [Betaproteobacteria bacterium]NCU99215.1 branched-chain amino acid ABC transporter permease [Betaproteobacteria bacterium]
MFEWIQTSIDGIVDGAIYALIGLGLSLSYSSLSRLNLAYGAIAMLAAYCGAWVAFQGEISMVLIALIVIGVAGLIGLYVEQLCFAKPLQVSGRIDNASVTADAGIDQRDLVALASSFAIWMQLEQLAINMLPRHMNAFPAFDADATVLLPLMGEQLILRLDRLTVAVLSIMLITVIHRLIKGSRVGLAWRAIAEHRMASHLMGISVDRFQTVIFILLSSLSGFTAFLILAIEGQVTAMFGMWMLLKGLTAAMLGGLGSVLGVMTGGLMLGLTEAWAQVFFGAIGREFAVYALLFLTLTLRSGLAARRKEQHFDRRVVPR